MPRANEKYHTAEGDHSPLVHLSYQRTDRETQLCAEELTIRSNDQLYRRLELPPKLPKTRGQENAFLQHLLILSPADKFW
ncbi:hypothetical protein T07_12951 [Trichinella nelsoni]|uniref:Uncharacterized protein n=1 Tax=Trichinella nelsoni TaxID=6336 RepID=A0A0V0S267_9BILA|nr:hypothetical protein T07_12951 [Trichinella nelsoni]